MQIRTNKEYNNSSFICNHHVSILWWRNLVKSQFALKITVLIAGVPYYLTQRDDVVTSSATVAAAMRMIRVRRSCMRLKSLIPIK